MAENRNTSDWAEYSQLVLAELKRLNEATEKVGEKVENLKQKLGEDIRNVKVDVDNKFKELETRNERERVELNGKFAEWDRKLDSVRGLDAKVIDVLAWVEKVKEVWSVSQMKETKDEVATQKILWVRYAGVIMGVNLAIGAIGKYFGWL